MKRKIKMFNAMADAQIFNWQGHVMAKTSKTVCFGTGCAIRNYALREVVV